jgi:hypothetical protein
VATKALNQAVKRNNEKFPSDFMFQLTPQELVDMKSQIVTSSSEDNRSQIVTGSGHGGRRKPVCVFTEHGAIMAATVLNSWPSIRRSRRSQNPRPSGLVSESRNVAFVIEPERLRFRKST